MYNFHHNGDYTRLLQELRAAIAQDASLIPDVLTIIAEEEEVHALRNQQRQKRRNGSRRKMSVEEERGGRRNTEAGTAPQESTRTKDDWLVQSEGEESDSSADEGRHLMSRATKEEVKKTSRGALSSNEEASDTPPHGRVIRSLFPSSKTTTLYPPTAPPNYPLRFPSYIEPERHHKPIKVKSFHPPTFGRDGLPLYDFVRNIYGVKSNFQSTAVDVERIQLAQEEDIKRAKSWNTKGHSRRLFFFFPSLSTIMSAEPQSFDLKVSLDATTRKFSIPSTPAPTWAVFSDQVKERFGLDEAIDICYLDDDGDVITLSSDVELQELWATFHSGATFQDFRFTINRTTSSQLSTDDLIATIQTAISKDPSVIGAIKKTLKLARKEHRHHPFGGRRGGKHHYGRQGRWHFRDSQEEESSSSSESETEVADDTDKEKDLKDKATKGRCGKHGKGDKHHHHRHHFHHGPPPPPPHFHHGPPHSFAGPPPPPGFPFAGPSFHQGRGSFGGRGRGRFQGGRGGFSGFGGHHHGPFGFGFDSDAPGYEYAAGESGEDFAPGRGRHSHDFHMLFE